MVECLTGDRGVTGSNLTRGTTLCHWARHLILCLVLVQHRKTASRHDLKLLRCKESKQTNKQQTNKFGWCSLQKLFSSNTGFLVYSMYYLRNRSAPAVNCWVIIHCLEVSCKEDQITSAQREWFIFAQLTDKQWIITQQFTQWSWSISILTHNKRRKHIRSLQLLPTFRHCTEELPPIFGLRRIRLHVIVTSFKRKNDVTPSNAMNDVICQWRQLSHTFAVNYCPIYHSLLPLAL